MSTSFIEKAKGFILNPTETLIAHRSESFGDALRYFCIFLTIYGVLTGLMIGLILGIAGGMAGAEAGLGPLATGGLAALGLFGTVIIAIIFIIIIGVIALCIDGGLLHIFVYIAGGRQGITTTMRAAIYAATPNFVLGWIPIVGIFTGIWSLALEILAIKELHEISTARAFIAVILPFIIMLILVVLGIAFFMIPEPTITHY